MNEDIRNDDIVGEPIFFLNENQSVVDEIIGDLSNALPQPLLSILLIRFEALIGCVEEADANGVLVASVVGDNLSLFIANDNENKIINMPIPSGTDEVERQGWVISNIQDVCNQLNLITDPAICQCLCGYAGGIENWISVLVGDLSI